MARPHTGLDDPLLYGRLRNHNRRSTYERRVAVAGRPHIISDIRQASPKATPAPDTKPVAPKAQAHAAPHKPVVHTKHPALQASTLPKKLPKRTTPLTPLAGQQHESILVITSAPRISDITRRVVKPQQQPVSTVLHAKHMPSKVLMREAVRPSRGKQLKAIQFRRLKYTLKNKAITLAALVVVVSGLGIGLYGLKANHAVATEAVQLSKKNEETHAEVAGASTDVPTETNAPDVSTYQVAATLPRAIRIEKSATNARVVRLGVKADNRLAAPSNIFDAGWYEASSKPGEAGAMLIDGHVSGPTKPGVFYNLKKVVAGDKITVERGDGKSFSYKVIKTKSYAADSVDMAAALTPVTAGKPGLNLITCTGAIDASRNHYEDRLLVFAEQI